MRLNILLDYQNDVIRYDVRYRYKRKLKQRHLNLLQRTMLKTSTQNKRSRNDADQGKNVVPTKLRKIFI